MKKCEGGKMKISSNVRRVIGFICFFICFTIFSCGIKTQFYSLQQYLPMDLLKELLISECLGQVSFLILLGFFEPIEYTYNGKKVYLMVIFEIMFILYLIFSYLQIM